MNLDQYKALLATDVSDAQGEGFAMDIAIKSLLTPAPRLMGLAYTVSCENRSNTYLHDAIYSAPKGSVIVAQVDANDYAVAGGNVCAVAQQNGVAGFVIDGVVRDLGEIRKLNFPVYARGAFPKPGGKSNDGRSEVEISCGGVTVNTGDLIIADEEGIVVVPQAEIETVMSSALKKLAAAESQSLADWRAGHEAKIKEILGK
ncbi:RraA family protein [Leucothrix sargassi]|nr:RraA family protein [Leucothrix sargassi]